MQLSSDIEMQKIPELTQEFFEHVLYDEDPLFISDEATIWDVNVNRRRTDWANLPVLQETHIG